MRGPVFDWLKTLEGQQDRMRDAVFVIPSATMLQGAIDSIDRLFDPGALPAHNQDILGDIYEYLLSEIAESGKNGQFRTPRHIIRAMCDLLDPQPGEPICDPACGTAGFLVNAYQHILSAYTNQESRQFQADGTPLHLYGDLMDPQQDEMLRSGAFFHGYDFDRTMVRLGWMNMTLHGLEQAQIQYADTLGSRFNEQLREIADFVCVLANPPYSGNIDKSDIGASLQWLGTTKTELLFIELIWQLLRDGGRAAVIVPEGVLFGSTSAHRVLRKKLVTENRLTAVVSLPGGVFQPYTGVKTSILLFTKGGSTEEVWFYEVAADGYGLGAKRTPQPEQNDLWDLVLKYRLLYGPMSPPSAPVFVDNETWRQWTSFDRDMLSRHYAQPRMGVEQLEETLPAAGQSTFFSETIAVPVFKRIQTAELAEAKDWTASLDQLAANDYNLSAGRYKPVTLVTVGYDPPRQIVDELQLLEEDIQLRLAQLRNLLEGTE